MRSVAKLAPLLSLTVLAACPFGPDDAPDPTSREALFGIWQGNMIGNVETTLRFLDDGSLEVLEAFIDDTRCRTASGWWEVSDGTFTYSVTLDGGGTDTGSGSYDVSGNTLTIDYATGDADVPEVLTRLDGPMPTCADYGWPTLQVFGVEVDGVPFDLTDPGPDPLLGRPDVSLSDIAEAGWLFLVASDGGGGSPCINCRSMTIDLSATPPIGPGTYTSDIQTPEDVAISYSCCQADPSEQPLTYASNAYDPNGFEGQATVTITVFEQYRLAGTFSGVLWADSTSVTVTGQFEVRYD